MLKTYFKVAWRNIKNNKVFSFINIFGLAVGLTCCILITLYIVHETSYDRFQKNGDRIFQIATVFSDETGEHKSATTAAPLGRMLQQDYSEVESSTKILSLYGDDKTLFQVSQSDGSVKSLYETKGFLADSNFLAMLSYKFKEGNAATALSEPNTVVINEDIATKLFGSEPALNRIVHISSSTNGDSNFRVAGVFVNAETPSHLDARFFLSFKGGSVDQWANNGNDLANNNMFHTYLLLKQSSDAEKLQHKFAGFIQRYLGEELKKKGKERSYMLTALPGIYLSGADEHAISSGSKTSLYILGSIALLTLLIACINFMNLSTANSAKRAAEVGVRKVLGAQKNALLRQFLGESLLTAVLALMFAGVFTLLLLPVFEQVAGKTLLLTIQQKLQLGGLFLLLAIITGILAGSYPAFYLSSFRPIKVLKGRFSNSLAAVSLRKGLVVVQFVISVALIVASVVIGNQMRYLRKVDLGFEKDQQIVIPLRTATAKTNIAAFKNTVANSTSISSIGSGRAYPGIFHPQDWLMYREGHNISNAKSVYINLIDESFLQTVGVRLVAGRLFSNQFPSDTLNTFVVNEETVNRFGFTSPQDAIGKWMAFEWQGQQYRFNIVGVVKNFHFRDLHESIAPFAFRFYNQPDAGFNYMIAHIKDDNVKAALTTLQSTWKSVNPNEPFEYSFLDQDFQKNYEADSRRANLINSFTIIAIIISCLGLFGLATFTAEQRTKEIGIRKVLGASITGLVALLAKDFLKLVAIAVLIASPLAWYAMNKWLENFAYRTTIGWQVFVITTILAMVIAFATISFQAVKAALANPVKNLRTE
jgi:putative ABC transport system permease protein